MTAIQICALISIIIAAAILYWTGYKGGLIDGKAEGADEARNIERADNAKIIKELKDSLQFIQADHKQLAQRCKKLTSDQQLSPDNYLTLLTIAEKLKLAAVTFKAVKSETHAAQTLALSEKARNMAAAMAPLEQGDTV